MRRVKNNGACALKRVAYGIAALSKRVNHEEKWRKMRRRQKYRSSENRNGVMALIRKRRK